MRRFDSAKRGTARREAPSLHKPPGRRASSPSDALAQANAALVVPHLTHRPTPHGA